MVVFLTMQIATLLHAICIIYPHFQKGVFMKTGNCTTRLMLILSLLMAQGFAACSDDTSSSTGCACDPGQVCNDAGECSTPQILISAFNPTTCQEDLCQASLTLSLSVRPSSPVTLTLAFSEEGFGLDPLDLFPELTIDPTSITFDKDNWNTPQQITLTGIPEDTIILLTVTSSSEYAAFNGLTAEKEIRISASQTLTPKINVTPNSFEVSESGNTAEILVSLTNPPTQSTTIHATVEPESECAINTKALYFDEYNYQTPQSIVISGEDDNVMDGNQTCNLKLVGESDDTDPATSYQNVQTFITGTNADDDKATIHVDQERFDVTESGMTAEISVSLTAKPTKPTTIRATITPETECEITSGAELHFDETNYQEPQNVVIRGIDDDDIDGDQPCILTLVGESDDTDPKTTYNQVETSIEGSNMDDDTVDVILLNSDALCLSENGVGQEACPESMEVCFRLSHKPTSNVKLQLSSDISEDLTISSSNLTMNADNYERSCVTLKALDDTIVDGDREGLLQIETSSDDPNFDKIKTAYPVTVQDRNRKAIIADFSGIPSSITEGNTTYKVKAKLGYKPTSSNYTLSFSCTNCPSSVTLSPTTMNLNSSQWDTWQEFSVQTTDDTVSSGNKEISLHFSVSNDIAPKVSSHEITYTDNDSPGITITCSTTSPYVSASSLPNGMYNLLGDEDGKLTCKVNLTKRPEDNVTVNITSTDNIISYVQTFTPSNYDTEKSFTVDFKYEPSINKAYGSFRVTAESKSSNYKASASTTAIYRYYIGHAYYFGYNGDTSNGFHDTGSPQTIDLPKGVYGLHAWGASGGLPYKENVNFYKIYKSNKFENGKFVYGNSGGYGDYIFGRLTLDSQQKMYVYVGGAGTGYEGSYNSTYSNRRGGYNGGSAGSDGDSNGSRGFGGGGATDFCIGSTSCSTMSSHYPYRILVAGGGGGAADYEGHWKTRYGGCADIWSSTDIRTHGHTNYYDGKNNKDVYMYGSTYYAPFGGKGTTNNNKISNPEVCYGKALEPDTSYKNSLKPFGGGGGGYYGGHVNNYMKESNVGGGAGSSFRWTGNVEDNVSSALHGKFMLTQNSSGSNIYKTQSGSYTCKASGKIISCKQEAGEYVVDTRTSPTRYGRYGDGFAIIEVLPAE